MYVDILTTAQLHYLSPIICKPENLFCSKCLCSLLTIATGYVNMHNTSSLPHMLLKSRLFKRKPKVAILYSFVAK